MNEINGLIRVDKPADWTSFDVVNKIRATLEHGQRAQTGVRKRIKVGHSGTLDPFATGLLLVAFGSCTKKLSELLKQDKKYSATLRLGASSTTGDPEGEITEVSLPKITTGSVEDVLNQFVGEVSQTPPSYSAIKIDGVAAYKRARRGEEVEIRARQVTIHSLALDSLADNQLKISADVSSGTYIRTLGEDIAAELGTGGYLTQLRRVSIGDFDLSGALNPTVATYEQILESAIDCK